MIIQIGNRVLSRIFPAVPPSFAERSDKEVIRSFLILVPRRRSRGRASWSGMGNWSERAKSLTGSRRKSWETAATMKTGKRRAGRNWGCLKERKNGALRKWIGTARIWSCCGTGTIRAGVRRAE
jgi:hypothetical protein